MRATSPPDSVFYALLKSEEDVAAKSISPIRNYTFEWHSYVQCTIFALISWLYSASENPEKHML